MKSVQLNVSKNYTTFVGPVRTARTVLQQSYKSETKAVRQLQQDRYIESLVGLR